VTGSLGRSGTGSSLLAVETFEPSVERGSADAAPRADVISPLFEQRGFAS